MVNKLNDESFSIALMLELIKNLPNWYGVDNWDIEVLPYHESFSNWVYTQLQKFHQLFFRNTALVNRDDFEKAIGNLSVPGASLVELSELYQLLQDEHSRSLLVSLIAYRILGYRKVKLPLNNSSYWEARKNAHSLIKSPETIQIGFRNWLLNHMDLEKVGYPIEIFSMPVWVVALFVLKQYEYQQGSKEIKAEAGDYVIDAGAGWGDTALYFSNLVGAKGKVYTFEFAAENLAVIQRNLDLNPSLAPQIQIVQGALWDKSNEGFDYAINGPATSLSSQPHQEAVLHVATLSIDDFVQEQSLPRMDFIKMDIEGAELKALMGAEKTIRAFKPKLAISVYHNQEDFVLISNYLHNLNLGYEFFLAHFTVYRGETILFAQVPIN